MGTPLKLQTCNGLQKPRSRGFWSEVRAQVWTAGSEDWWAFQVVRDQGLCSRLGCVGIGMGGFWSSWPGCTS